MVNDFSSTITLIGPDAGIGVGVAVGADAGLVVGFVVVPVGGTVVGLGLQIELHVVLQV